METPAGLSLAGLRVRYRKHEYPPVVADDEVALLACRLANDDAGPEPCGPDLVNRGGTGAQAGGAAGRNQQHEEIGHMDRWVGKRASRGTHACETQPYWLQGTDGAEAPKVTHLPSSRTSRSSVPFST